MGKYEKRNFKVKFGLQKFLTYISFKLKSTHMKLIWYVWTEGWHATEVVETTIGNVEYYLN